MYKHILLDLDDTILDFNASETFAFQKVAEDLGVTYSETLLDHYKIYNQSLWQKIEKNELTKAELMTQRFPGFFSQYGIHNLIGQEIDDLFRDYLATGAHVVPGAQQLLIDLKKAGKQVYAASNGIYTTQISRLEQANLIEYFDELFISEKLGYNKPHAGFFEQVFKQLEPASFDSSIMVGDSLSSDIKGANAVKLPVVWFNPNNISAPKDLTIDYQISDLTHLYDILDL